MKVPNTITPPSQPLSFTIPQGYTHIATHHRQDDANSITVQWHIIRQDNGQYDLADVYDRLQGYDTLLMEKILYEVFQCQPVGDRYLDDETRYYDLEVEPKMEYLLITESYTKGVEPSRRANVFHYLGEKYMPAGRFKSSDTFQEITRSLMYYASFQPAGYTYEAFYKAAARIKGIAADIFRLSSSAGNYDLVVPGATQLFMLKKGNAYDAIP